MNLRHMEVFHAIMLSGSVTGAARLLNVSQPAISATLRHCEAQLRLTLFERTGSGLQPTPEARAIYPHVAAVFRGIDTVGRISQDMREERRGEITVASAAPVAHTYLAWAVAMFIREHPMVHISIQSLTHSLLLDRVINQEVELGITYGPVSDALVERWPLLQSEIACVLRCDHPLAAKLEIEIADLVPYPLISFAPQTIMRTAIDRAFQEAGITPEIRIRVSQSLTAIMLANAGAGIGLTEPMLLEALPFPDLVRRPLRPRIPLEAFLVHPKGPPLSQTMRQFIRCLRDVVSQRTNQGLARGDAISIFETGP